MFSHRKILLWLGLVCAFALPWWSGANPIKVAVFSDHYKVIQSTLNRKGCVAPDSYTIGENQMLAEFLLFCSALKTSKITEFELIPYPIIGRAFGALAEDEVDALGFGVWWDEAITHRAITSVPVLNRGSFTKGLYGTKQVIDTYAGTDFLHFSDLIVVANKNWTQDWKALSCTGLNLLHVDRYQQMFNLVDKSRAEFLPLTFSAQSDLKRQEFGVTLYPLPNMKIVINQSLHFAVGSSENSGLRLLQKLNKGLAQLKQAGKIDETYKKLGLINANVNNWKTIGC